MRQLLAASLLLLAGVMAGLSQAQTVDSSAGPLRAEIVAEGLVHPWAIAFLPDGRLLVTERPGRLRIIGPQGRLGAPIEAVPDVVAARQGGLLDVALAPDFAQTGRVYLSYAEPADAAGDHAGSGTAVMAATLVIVGDTGRLADRSVIFRMNRFTRSGVHYGSRIMVAPDGTLWITLGERGDRDRAQDPHDLAGAVVRIAPDGTIPPDNPFAAGEAAHPAIWSLGHRNPQGAALGPDGALWIAEHGARGGDEVNRPEPGLNYGWPVISYGRHYSGEAIGIGNEAPGYEQPLHYWDPSIAPSGLAFYDGALFPGWQGDLLVGALRDRMLVRLEVEDGAITGEERLFQGAFGRIRDVRSGPDGAIYLATDEPEGRIIRVAPAARD